MTASIRKQGDRLGGGGRLGLLDDAFSRRSTGLLSARRRSTACARTPLILIATSLFHQGTDYRVLLDWSAVQKPNFPLHVVGASAKPGVSSSMEKLLYLNQPRTPLRQGQGCAAGCEFNRSLSQAVGPQGGSLRLRHAQGGMVDFDHH